MARASRGPRLYGVCRSGENQGCSVWTKNHLESPAEVVAISLSSDEPVWSAELGGDVDLTPSR